MMLRRHVEGYRGRTGLLMTLIGSIALISLTDMQRAAAQAPKSPVTMEAITEAAKKRQERVRSARFVWKKQYTELRGSFSERLKRFAGREKLPDAVMPPKDTTVAHLSSLEFDGDNIRFQYEGKTWYPRTNAYIMKKEISVFSKGVGKQLTTRDVEMSYWPEGSIQREGSFIEAGGPETRTFTFLYRAMSSALRPFPLRDFKVSGRRMTIDRVSCAELLSEHPRGRQVARVWVAPTRDYVMTRMIHETDNRVIFQLTVQYREDPRHGWVPSSWQVVNNTPEGRLLTSTVSTVTEYQINDPIPSTTFDLAFPPGALVVDQRSRQDYVIKPTGEKRIILRKEIGATYEQLINSDTGEAFGKPKGSKIRTWSSILIWLTAILALLLYFYRRLRRRVHRASEPGSGPNTG